MLDNAAPAYSYNYLDNETSRWVCMACAGGVREPSPENGKSRRHVFVDMPGREKIPVHIHAAALTKLVESFLIANYVLFALFVR